MYSLLAQLVGINLLLIYVSIGFASHLAIIVLCCLISIVIVKPRIVDMTWYYT